jgi:hypothetical protein
MDARIDALELETRETRAAMARIDLTLMRIEERMATKEDLAALRSETREAIGALRSETREAIDALRNETREGIGALRNETREGIGALRGETRESIAALTLSTKVDLARMDGKISNLPTTWTLITIIVTLVFAVMGGTLGLFRLFHP